MLHSLGIQNKEILTERKDFKKYKIVFDDAKIDMTDDTPIKILVKNDIQMMVGGYWDGRIVIQNFTRGFEISKKKHLYKVTCIEVSENEDIVVTGTEKGDIAKWRLEGSVMHFEKPFFHHQDIVTNAYIHEDLGVFAT